MSRPVLLMFAGGAALLVALVVLYDSTRPVAVPNDRSSAPAADGNEPPRATRQTSPTAASSSAPASRAGRIPSPSGGTMWRAPTPAAPSPESAEPAPEQRDEPENLHYGGTQLRAQAKAVEPHVRACVDKAVAAGLTSTGHAMLTYIVAKRGDKYLIEDTGIDAEKTTLQNDGLLECLHQTAKQMKFVGLPKQAEALVVTRSVKLEHGQLTEYKHVSFSYLH